MFVRLSVGFCWCVDAMLHETSDAGTCKAPRLASVSGAQPLGKSSLIPDGVPQIDFPRPIIAKMDANGTWYGLMEPPKQKEVR